MTISKTSTLPPWLWMSRARQKLAQYLEAGTSEISLGVGHEVHRTKPNNVYFDAARDGVARASPYPMLPSMTLPPGHAYSSRHPDGTPLLIYRDAKDYTTKAYINSCRHRGAPLLHPHTHSGSFETTPLNKGPLLTCPYHAWTYDARSGELKGIPGHERAFCKMDKTPFSLHSVPCQEQAGMIWVGGDKLQQKGLWSMDEMHAELEPFMFSPFQAATNPPHASHIIAYREWELPVNWQLLVETGLESYHVKSLHQKTLNKVTHPIWAMVSDWFDQDCNFRMTLPLRNFSVQDKQQLDQSNNNEWTERDIQKFLGQTSSTYLLFPMVLMVFTKRFFLVATMEPMPTQSTSSKDHKHNNNSTTDNGTSAMSKVRAWGLSHRFYDPSTEEDGVENQKRDFHALVTAVEEDWNCTVDIQEGLNANATDEFVYGGYEGNNVQYLKNIGSIADQLQKMEEDKSVA